MNEYLHGEASGVGYPYGYGYGDGFYSSSGNEDCSGYPRTASYNGIRGPGFANEYIEGYGAGSASGYGDENYYGEGDIGITVNANGKKDFTGEG